MGIIEILLDVLALLVFGLFFIGGASKLNQKIRYNKGSFRSDLINAKMFDDKLIYCDEEDAFKKLTEMKWVEPLKDKSKCRRLTNYYCSLDYKKINSDLSKSFSQEDAITIGEILHNCYIGSKKDLIEQLMQFSSVVLFLIAMGYIFPIIHKFAVGF